MLGANNTASYIEVTGLDLRFEPDQEFGDGVEGLDLSLEVLLPASESPEGDLDLFGMEGMGFKSSDATPSDCAALVALVDDLDQGSPVISSPGEDPFLSHYPLAYLSAGANIGLSPSIASSCISTPSLSRSSSVDLPTAVSTSLIFPSEGVDTPTHATETADESEFDVELEDGNASERSIGRVTRNRANSVASVESGPSSTTRTVGQKSKREDLEGDEDVLETESEDEGYEPGDETDVEDARRAPKRRKTGSTSAPATRSGKSKENGTKPDAALKPQCRHCGEARTDIKRHEIGCKRNSDRKTKICLYCKDAVAEAIAQGKKPGHVAKKGAKGLSHRTDAFVRHWKSVHRKTIDEKTFRERHDLGG
ncbi:hypothetical protein OBBRIDRAFT_835558 [Obba rivulosa]|uniref:Uncharacterized protein n=1 Tax=Obba rivulosa TaxID=1052685 RepID=A0A8E2AV11_9APHY|nr:hypothetical protein OBBRIDRAFT_835558 [Obba rivulosa]